MSDPSRIPQKARSALRRRQVLDAALGCFSEKGIEATSIEDICSRAGASVGSLYHQFNSKSGVAAALYLDALADFHTAVTKQLGKANSGRAGIHTLVSAHIRWVEKKPDRARFLLEMRHAESIAGHGDEIAALNRRFAEEIGSWVKACLADFKVMPIPIDLFIAQLLGPTHEYVRGKLAGRPSSPSKIAIQLLTDGACRGLGVETYSPAPAG